MQFFSDRSTSSRCVSALVVVAAATLLSICSFARAQDNVTCVRASLPEQPSSSAESATFVSVAQRNLARLDCDRDGTLTLDELEIALQDHRYQDEDAAAVAALFWGAQTAKENHVLGSYRIAGPNNDFDSQQLARADGGVAVAKVGAHYYRAGLTKLRNANRVLFTNSGPHLDSIRQIWTSDCYFISSVGAIAHFTPERLVRMIQKEGGSYRVTFPGKAPKLIPEPTDAELAAFTNASDGIWFSLLEKAYSLHKHVRPVTPHADALDAVAAHGGQSEQVLKTLTGHDIQAVPFRTKGGTLASP